MSELREWFKVWALKSINSADLDDLSDHEERVWWRLLMWASLEDERWYIRSTPKLPGKCASTPAKFASAVAHFITLGMVEDSDGLLFVVNGKKWNEDTERRKPSDAPPRTRQRKQAQRERDRENVTPDVTPMSRPSLFEEKEKEEEKEERLSSLSAAEREILDTILSTLPTKYRHDPLTVDELELFARDFASYHNAQFALGKAIAECRRNRELCFAGNLRKYMPGAERRSPNGTRTGQESRRNPSARDRMLAAGWRPDGAD